MYKVFLPNINNLTNVILYCAVVLQYNVLEIKISIGFVVYANEPRRIESTRELH